MGIIEETIAFHSEVTGYELELQKAGYHTTEEELYKMAKKIYNLYYENIVPIEELEKYKPNDN